MKQDQKSQAATVTPELIFQVASGFMAAKHLFFASEVGLFEHLADSPATLDELSSFTGIAWPEETQRIVSEGVAAIQAAPSQALPSTFDFGRHRRILDLGRGVLVRG